MERTRNSIQQPNDNHDVAVVTVRTAGEGRGRRSGGSCRRVSCHLERMRGHISSTTTTRRSTSALTADSPEVDDPAVVLGLAKVPAGLAHLRRAGAGARTLPQAVAGPGVAGRRGGGPPPQAQRRGVARALLGQHQHLAAVRHFARRHRPPRRVHGHERPCEDSKRERGAAVPRPPREEQQ